MARVGVVQKIGVVVGQAGDGDEFKHGGLRSREGWRKVGWVASGLRELSAFGAFVFSRLWLAANRLGVKAEYLGQGEAGLAKIVAAVMVVRR